MMDFVLKMRVFLKREVGEAVIGAISVRKLEDVFKKWGVVFHGKPVRTKGVRCFLLVEKYAANEAVREAAKAL